MNIFEQSIMIQAPTAEIERCFTELSQMRSWLNPALGCEPIDDHWSTELGSRSRFWLKVPFVKLTLHSVVSDRPANGILWQFTGFFRGSDRWEWVETEHGVILKNRFEFSIPSPVVQWGFELFAARWTKHDMKAQLKRIQAIAETSKAKKVL